MLIKDFKLNSAIMIILKGVKTSLLTMLGLLLCSVVYAQPNNKVSFFGLGRATLEQTQLSGKAVEQDSTNVKQANRGNTLIDLGLNVKPNANTQINLIFRARNEFGGFYGSGATVNVRQLFVKGAIAKKVNYKIGDIDLKQTKYTLWNYEEEGKVNEATSIRMLRDIIYYENFYNKNNEWRVQGAQTDFSFTIKNIIQQWTTQGYVARIKAASNAPEKLIAGFSSNIDQSKYLSLGVNYTNTFEVAKTAIDPTTFRNPVLTVTAATKIESDKLKAKLFTEFGQSALEFVNTPVTVGTKQGGMMELGASLELKNIGLTASASFRSVSSDFFSAAAQSKRINYNQANSLFPTLGNNLDTRAGSLWDLSRDYKLYNRNLTQQLMTYNPRYANTLAYGDATPNRQGVIVGLDYQHKKQIIDAFLNINLLDNIKGEGSLEAKKYQLIKTGATISVDKILDAKKILKVNVGYGSDQVKRSGDAVSSVNYTSNILDAGVDIEVLKNTELLAGIKTIHAKGTEYLPIRDQYNQIQNYSLLKDDHKENILALGVKYRFTKNINVSLQNHYVKIADFGTNYAINQTFILFNLIY